MVMVSSSALMVSILAENLPIIESYRSRWALVLRVGGIVDGHYFETGYSGASQPASDEIPPDASKTVNRYSNHCVLPSVY